MLQRTVLAPYDRYGISTFVSCGDTVYIGHFGGSWDADGQKLTSVAAQVARTFENLEKALKEIGLGLNDLATVTVILREITDFQEMHKAWEQIFPEYSPVRTTLTSAFVEDHCRVQIDGIACRSGQALGEDREGFAMVKECLLTK